MTKVNRGRHVVVSHRAHDTLKAMSVEANVRLNAATDGATLDFIERMNALPVAERISELKRLAGRSELSATRVAGQLAPDCCDGSCVIGATVEAGGDAPVQRSEVQQTPS